MLSLFIGANDVCVGACHYEKRFDAEEFGEYLREVLRTVRDRIPRVLVNVVRVYTCMAGVVCGRRWTTALTLPIIPPDNHTTRRSSSSMSRPFTS